MNSQGTIYGAWPGGAPFEVVTKVRRAAPGTSEHNVDRLSNLDCDTYCRRFPRLAFPFALL